MDSASFISIYGDSISTLLGYTPEDGVFYDPAFSRNTKIRCVEDTWWHKVICGVGGTLLVNDSHAGSSVCRGGYQAAATPWRVAKLKQQDRLPDCILVYSGLNDVATYRSAQEFGEQYRMMLQLMAEAYPDAIVWCGTLCRGFQENPNLALFLNLDYFPPLQEYNDAMCAAVQASPNGRLADLAGCGVAYSSVDGVHPNKAGMETLAQLWLRCLLHGGAEGE